VVVINVNTRLMTLEALIRGFTCVRLSTHSLTRTYIHTPAVARPR